MLKAKCPNCGKIYYGWSLVTVPQKACPECGYILNIKDKAHPSAIKKSNNKLKNHKQP
jgi:phage FluMu protein Com